MSKSSMGETAQSAHSSRLTRTLTALGLSAALLLTGPAAAMAAETGDDAESGLPAYDVTPWLPDGTLDLQAHRGGISLVSESTLDAFANALELGVTTLELDTHVTADEKVVVWHDRQIFDHLCRDTEPAFEGDPDYPYVEKYIADLTLEQIQTLECGYQPHPNWPDQQTAPGPMIELHELFDLIHEYQAYDVAMNIETKVEAGAPEETQPREVFVPAVIGEIEAHGMEDQVSIQSFDWGALMLVEQLNPDLPRVALTNYDFLQIGEPGASPWLGGLDADDFDGDLVAIAEHMGVEAISPVHGHPQDGTVNDDQYTSYTTAEMVEDAHAAGISVIPWTVNDADTMRSLIESGVDGIITDRPDTLRAVMDEYGIPLPAPRSRVIEEPDDEDEDENEDEEDEGGVVDLQIVSTNDFHGRLERDGEIAGAEIMACSVDALREENPNTVFVGAGDQIGASTFTSWATDDEAAVEALNLMGLDVSSVGNHEFDRGWPDLRDRVAPLSDFTWLGANAVDSTSGEPILDPYEIHSVGGVDIAFIGLNTVEMPRLVSPGGIEGIEWQDLDETANYWAEHIAEHEEADLTVVLVHDGINGTSLDQASGQFGDLVDNAHEDIAAIISGHTHREYAEQTGSGVWVTQAGEYTKNLGRLSLSYDTATGEIVDSQAEVLPLIGEDEEPLYCAEGDRPDLAQLVDDAVATADEVGSEVIGEADAGFARAVNETGEENRSARSTLSDLIADGQAWAARQSANEVDFAVMNPGGVRADLPPGTEGAGGEVTYRDLATIQPFGNLINSVEITGADFKEVLELQWREGRDLLLGISEELTYTYDPSGEYGDRVTGIWLNGEELDPEATYLVAANSFLAEGGDGFAPFASGNLGTTGQVDMDGFITFFQQGRDGHLEIAPHLAKRSTALTWVSDEEAVYSAGEEIALDIAGLAWNTPGLNDPESVEVALGGEDMGAFEVDSSWPDAQIGEDNDLRGAAEIRLEMPELDTDGEAEVPLTITEPETGLELNLSVTAETGSTGDPSDEEPAEDPSDDPSGEPSESPRSSPGSGPAPAGSSTADEEDSSAAAAPGGQSGQQGGLARTGATVAAVAALALALLILGTVLVISQRRKARQEV